MLERKKIYASLNLLQELLPLLLCLFVCYYYCCCCCHSFRAHLLIIIIIIMVFAQCPNELSVRLILRSPLHTISKPSRRFCNCNSCKELKKSLANSKNKIDFSCKSMLLVHRNRCLIEWILWNNMSDTIACRVLTYILFM